MAVPIREELDYVGTARKFFEIDVLAQGQIARYDFDIDVPSYVVSKRGKVDEYYVEGEFLEPPTWEIFAPASIRLSEVQVRRFNVLDRTQEKIRISTQIQEDDQLLALLDNTAEDNTDNNPIVESDDPKYLNDKDFLNRLSSVVQDRDIPLYGFLMRFSSFKDIRIWGREDFDPVTMREVLETGLYGTIWGIDLVVSRRVFNRTVFAIAEPRFFGIMPIRTEMMLMPNDNPNKATIGYVGYEEIGMAIANANGLAKGTHFVETPSP